MEQSNIGVMVEDGLDESNFSMFSSDGMDSKKMTEQKSEVLFEKVFKLL